MKILLRKKRVRKKSQKKRGEDEGEWSSFFGCFCAI
jgi:hypothetical protein